MLPERSDPDRTNDRSSEIGENVPKQVGGNHNVKPVRMAHKMRTQNIDEILIAADIRKSAGHRSKSIVPNGMVYTIPFDFVAEATCLLCLRASSKA